MKKVLIFFFLVCFFLLILAGNIFAQTDVQNTGVLYIGSSVDTVYIGGSFTNSAAASLTNNSVLNIKQQLSNSQASMSAGSGTLYLNGSTAQTVSGSQVFKTNHLVTDNSNGFTLNNNVSVSGVHTFTNGLITTSATPNYMIYEAGASYTGDNDSRHINGWVKKLGTTDFVFPVGNGNYERTVALNSLGSSSEFAVKYNRAVSPNYTSLYGTLVLVDTSEYWTINRISGSTATVTHNWDHAKVPVPQVIITGIQATYWDGTFWRSIGGSATGSVAATGAITSASTNAFNTNFTIGSTALVLPLQLISFTATGNNGINLVNWKVANEMGIKNYELQRSDDRNNFYSISTQHALNNGGNATYAYSDAAFAVATIYYRLKYTDGYGIVKYSTVIAVSPARNGSSEFYLVNNPVTDTKIEFYASGSYKGRYMYSIAGASGQVVQTGMVDITAGGLYTIPIRAVLATGVYVLSLQNSQQTLQKTFLKN